MRMKRRRKNCFEEVKEQKPVQMLIESIQRVSWLFYAGKFNWKPHYWSLWSPNRGTYINLKLPEYIKGSVFRLVQRWIDTRGHQVTYHKSKATERAACNINKIHCTLLLFTSFNGFDTLQYDGRTVIGWARCHCSSKNIPLACWMRKTHARSRAGHTKFRNKFLWRLSRSFHVYTWIETYFLNLQLCST